MAGKESPKPQKTTTDDAPETGSDAPAPKSGAAPADGGSGAGGGATAAAMAAEWSGEPFRFLTHRIDRQIEHLGALMACRSPGEVFELETRFTMQSMQDYLDESHRLLERAASVGSEMMGAWQGMGRPGA